MAYLLLKTSMPEEQKKSKQRFVERQKEFDTGGEIE